jgi:hypothetical protein
MHSNGKRDAEHGNGTGIVLPSLIQIGVLDDDREVLCDHMGFVLSTAEARRVAEVAVAHADKVGDAEIEEARFRHLRKTCPGMVAQIYDRETRNRLLGLPRRSPWTVEELEGITGDRKQAVLLHWVIRHCAPGDSQGILQEEVADAVEEPELESNALTLFGRLSRLVEAGLLKRAKKGRDAGVRIAAEEIQRRIEAAEGSDACPAAKGAGAWATRDERY